MTRHARDDELLRAAFSDLRATDQQTAPAFDDVLAHHPASASFAGSAAILRLAVAVGLVIAVSFGYRAIGARGLRLTVPDEVIVLSAWRPATDVLLETPGRDLLRHSPRLGASLIDIALTGDPR